MDEVNKSYTEAYSNLNDAQKEAVDHSQGPLLIIAGPGTGKTQLLATRIVNILRTEDVMPENILCLTFTESGQAAMRQRLVNILGKAAYDITISTYHSFGSELIRRFPEYFKYDDPAAQPIDDLTADILLRNIFELLPYNNPLKSADLYLKDVRSLISEFKRSLLSPTEIKQISTDNLAFIKKITPKVTSSLSPLKITNKSSVTLFENLLNDISSLLPPNINANQIKPLSFEFISSLKHSLDEFKETGKTKSLVKWKNSWLAKNSTGGFIPAGERENIKLASLSEIYQQYLDLLAASHFYDYDDMILRAIAGLQNHTDLKLTLQEQYQYLLLDEFQDTNSAQLKLIQLLTDNPVNEGRPNVMAVGDDDQAIYAFQGADYSNMLTFQQMYKDVKIIALTQNYRSHTDILKFAHAVASQIKSRLDSQLLDLNKLLVSCAQNLPLKASIERHEFKSDVAQFAWIAGQVQNLIKQGIKPSEIAILAPKHRYLEPLVPFLTASSVAVRYEKRENILQDAYIEQLLNMADLVLSIKNKDLTRSDELWPQILSYEFWDIPVEVIWKISWKAYDEKINWLPILLNEPLAKNIANFFIHLSQISGTETLETMLDYLTGSLVLPVKDNAVPKFSSPFFDYNFGPHARSKNPGRFWQVLTNLTVLRQRINEYRGSDTVLKLEDLLSFVSAHKNAGIKILNTSPYHESADAVELMTAYKAKGQEFEAVFIIAAQDEAWGTLARNKSSAISLPTNLKFIRYGGMTEDERLRLFFVALTRTKTHLYLTNYTSNYNGKPTTRLKFLEEVEQDGKIISKIMPINNEVIQNDSNAPTEADLKPYWQQKYLQSADSSGLKSLLQPRLQKFRLSPSNLTSYIDIVNSGPEYFFLSSLLKFPNAKSPSIHFGDAIHATIEWIHNHQKLKGELPNITKIISIFEVHLDKRDMTLEQYKLLIARGREVLSIFMKKRAHTFNKDDLHEFNFYNQGVIINGAHLSGVVDKISINKLNKTITIVDFKTGKSAIKLSASIKLHKYQMQLYFYKILIERSRAFKGYKVNTGVIEFVEPDESGQISSLELTFDDKETEKIIKLTRAVWDNIMKLNFPDISEFPKTLKGILDFEEELLNKKSAD